MEQTTTWLCPVCERTLDCKDLIVDGYRVIFLYLYPISTLFLSYFDEILKQSPESIEDVVVEADGEWHTSDNKYGSMAWKAAHPPATLPKAPTSPRKSLPAKTPPRSPSKGVNGDPNGKRKATEIVVLDSDDEDEGRVKRELSPSFASSSSVNRSYGSIPAETAANSQSDAVIDLTLDSDDEELPRPPAKRTASAAGILSPTEQIWKKGRLDVDRTASSSGGDFVLPQATVALTAARPTLPVPAYPPAGYSGPVLPPVYNNSFNRGGTTSTVQLSPTSTQYLNRPRW